MDTLDSRFNGLRDLGTAARERARLAGTPSYYLASDNKSIIREMPDGTRQIVELAEGEVTVIRHLPSSP